MRESENSGIKILEDEEFRKIASFVERRPELNIHCKPILVFNG